MDTINVTDMSCMFKGARAFNRKITMFISKERTNTDHMFQDALAMEHPKPYDPVLLLSIFFHTWTSAEQVVPVFLSSLEESTSFTRFQKTHVISFWNVLG